MRPVSAGTAVSARPAMATGAAVATGAVTTVVAVAARRAMATAVPATTGVTTALAAPTLVDALVADRRVEDPDDVHGVAADVDRHMHRCLHGVAGQYAGRVRTGAARARVRVGDTARGGDHSGRGRHGHQTLAGDLSHC